MTNPTDENRDALREELRAMLLPVAPEHEEDALEAAAGELSRLGISPPDHPAWVRLQRDIWRDKGEPGDDLVSVTAAYLEAGEPQLGADLASVYYRLHRQLAEQHLFSHDDAAAFLSHTRLIVHLAGHERMSSAQIDRILRARDQRVDFSWRAIQRVLRTLHMQPRLDRQSVKQLYARDEELEQLVFADAGLATCAEILGDAGTRLGFPGSVDSIASTLFRADGSTFGPYLQILHFLCVIAEFYDHALSVLYEFSPRGDVANWLFDQYPAALIGAGNPVLNNAKGVDRLTDSWAASRKSGEAEQARALVALVVGLENMGFASRQELAGWLRRWLIRLAHLTEPLASRVPERLTKPQVEQVMEVVAAGETNTRGIIEQRVVDALTCTLYGGSEWRSRGLGDSVNASNVSRKKFGDCDYQNAATREVVAYEAHAGRLADVYVDGHRRTLSRVLAIRREEFEGIADPAEWGIRIVFVAHDVAASLPIRYEEDGIKVAIECQTYAELRASMLDERSLRTAVERHVVKPLNEKRTPAQVRRRFLDIVGA